MNGDSYIFIHPGTNITEGDQERNEGGEHFPNNKFV